MIKLFDSQFSGNSWKIRLMCRHLGMEIERVTLNLAEGPHRQPSFMRRNPFARVPVIEMADGRHLYESGAILLHLAEGSELLPSEPVARSVVTAWLFHDACDLWRFLSFPRFWTMIGQDASRASEIAHYHAIAAEALVPLEMAFAGGRWVTGERLSVADFALFPYIRLSAEGGFDLAAFPAIRRWLDRFEALPCYEPLAAAPTPPAPVPVCPRASQSVEVPQ